MISSIVSFSADLPVRGENQNAFTSKAEGAWSELKNVTVPSINEVITDINAEISGMNTLATSAQTSATNAYNSATSAATSAATASAKAALAQAVVIPTTATYNNTTQDWRSSMMSKAEFNAVANERRANRAGSGFDVFDTNTDSNAADFRTTFINGLSTYSGSPIETWMANSFGCKPSITTINGVMASMLPKGVFTSTNENNITLPPAPTVLPYTATLTQEQIDSGVIKHADASNSGLIINGKFDTDTSGWTGYAGAILSVVNNKLRVTEDGITASPEARQAITTVIGKQYILELYLTYIDQPLRVFIGSVSSGGSSDYTGSSITSSGRVSVTFTASSTSTLIRLQLQTTAGGTSYVELDNIAVFPADAISRSDLVFLESWHEDVTEKDFVYPLGNVQYLGTTGDCGTTVAGAFAGSATYSLFSDTWQSDGALVGKGYVWSTLSDANKKAFVANHENNCYLDGDKVIQVRYRMRVVMGWGDSWNTYDAQYGGSGQSKMLGYTGLVSAGKAEAKGKITALPSVDLVYPSSTNRFVTSNTVDSVAAREVGAFALEVTNTLLSYNGQVFALPIALVHRRNQGGYNATYNPNGTKTMTMTPTSISDCFNPANYTATTGYIGTSTSRPDGLFYDQVSVEDFKPSNKGADLRCSSKKRTAGQIIQEFVPKVIAGTLQYNTNDTTALTTYKDEMSIRDTSGNIYGIKNRIGNVVTIQQAVANKKGFSVVTSNGKCYLQVADDATSDDTVQMNLSTIKYDIGVFDA